MNREIKFRGKRVYVGDWVYGYLYELPLPSGEACMILTQDNNHLDNSLEPKYHLAFTLWVDLFLVEPESVGQFTGLQDANGVDIYEGDLLFSYENGEVFEVVYDAPEFCFKDNVFGFKFINHPENFKVIGNIFDNEDFMERQYHRPRINNVAELLKDNSYYTNYYPATHTTYEDLEKRLMGCEKVVGGIFGIPVAKDVDRCYGFEVVSIDGDVAIVNYIGLMKS